MAARNARVQDEPAFVLHHHDWSEASLILDVFSRHHGRVVLAAKGVKRPSSQFRPVLLPLQPLRLGWGGDAEVRTLKSAQWQGGHVMPGGDALLSGYYLNELLMRLLAREDPHPRLFDHYAHAVHAMVVGDFSQQAVLRSFELLLLRETGFLPALNEEGASLAPLAPEALYELIPESGLRQCNDNSADGLQGRIWQALQSALDDLETPFKALLPVCQTAQTALRQQTRALLHYHSGVRVFQTRQIMLDVQQLSLRRT